MAKGLLLLLLASFAVWGISGQIANGVGGDNVITAGDTKVSAQDYRLAYDRQLAVLSRQLGQRISAEQARQFGLDQMVLGQLVSGALLDEEASEMNLGLSKDRLASLVAEDPAFSGLNGQFSRSSFRSVLNNAGMSEADYIKNRQQVAIRQQIAEAVSDGITVPNALLEAAAQHAGTTRDVEYITLDESAVPPIDEPDDETLKAFYDEHQQEYVAPEYRKLNYVRLTPEDIADPASIAEDEVRADYDARKDRYTQPETRTVEQLVFQDEASAAAAHERILAGESFEKAVEEAGRTMSDVSLGTVKKSDIVDDAVADAAFALEFEGATSDVVDGSFGPVLVHVSKINAETVQSYDEVKDQIRQELALVQANDTLLDVHDAYEDARAGGNSMQEAAQNQRLDMQTIEAVDAQGRTPEGDMIDLPERQALLQDAFESDVGVENPPLDAGNLGFLWYEVADIQPSRQLEFEEVRDRVKDDWTAQETDRLLDERAEELAKRLEGGEDLEAIAQDEGLTVENKYGLGRNASDPDFGRQAITEVFNGGPDHTGYVRAPSGDARQIFKVTSASEPLGGAEALDPSTRTTLRDGMQNDLLDQLVAQLQSKYTVRVNQTALDQALNLQ